MSNLIQKYIPKRDLADLKKLEDALAKKEITVTCMGLYNHGKSTLLNALIDDLELKTFKTADVRETSENKSIKADDIVYVDTPGLNAKDYDDKRVYDAIKTSDINLFTHNVTTGEFTQKEIEFLNRVKKNWGDSNRFIDNTIFVISRVDGATSKEDIVNTISKMQEQILDIFGKEAIFIPVSAINYIKGKKENKNILAKKSNIDTLKEAITNKKESIKSTILKEKKKKLLNKYDSIIKTLNSKRNKIELELSGLKREEKRYSRELEEKIMDIESYLRKQSLDITLKKVQVTMNEFE